MNVILLSGGSGKRLWPLSNDVRGKQFIKLFRRPGPSIPAGVERADAYESMVQRICRQIKTADADAVVTVAAPKAQLSEIRNQLGADVDVSVEPCGRDTFPAIALAAAYLHDVRGIGLDEAVVVCPVDPYVNDDYFAALRKLWELARAGTASLMLMGIDPTGPSEKYGYIMPAGKGRVSKVDSFKEKPDAAAAQRYIDAGGLWNAGVFACRLGYVLDRAHELIDFTGHADLFARYDTLTGISFDYAVVERESDIAVLRFAGEWKDLGTWDTLTQAMEGPAVGDVRLNETCENVHVINELAVPVLVVGGKDMVVCASPEGILIADKEQSGGIKPYVDAIGRRSCLRRRAGGSDRAPDAEEGGMTVKLTPDPGEQ